MNLAVFTGNLGRAAETRYTPSGTAVASFPLAVKSGWGEREKTLWVRCNLWGKRAEGGVVQHLVKGQQVAVSGELSVSEFDKRDGTRGFALELNIRDLDLVGGQRCSDAPGGAQDGEAVGNHAMSGSEGQKPAPAGDSADFFDDDIPF